MSGINERIKNREYIIIIPAYNEERSIAQALDAIKQADKKTSLQLKKVVVCINGCTDCTEKVVKSYKKLPIKIIHSQPGYLAAMNTLISYAREYYPYHMAVKTDADSTLAPNALSLMLSEFDKHPELVVVGGHPMPLSSENVNFFQNIKGRMLSIRNRYPLSEMAINNVADYHPFADSDPQPSINEAEKQTKIYFHGRLWSARESQMIPLIHNKVIGDDVYLGDLIYKLHGPGGLRVVYGAQCFFRPYHSIVRHWKVYKRIYEDKQRVRGLTGHEKFHNLRKTKLNWRFILSSVPVYDIALFVVYAAVRRLEEFSYPRTKYRKSYWQYQEKEI